MDLFSGEAATLAGTAEYQSTVGSVVIPAGALEADSTEYNVGVVAANEEWMFKCYELWDAQAAAAASEPAAAKMSVQSLLRVSVTQKDNVVYPGQKTANMNAAFSFNMPVTSSGACGRSIPV